MRKKGEDSAGMTDKKEGAHKRLSVLFKKTFNT